MAHEAFGYLCHAYGLEQMGIEGLSADDEPDPKQMSEVIRFAKEHQVKTIFFEELVSPKVAKTIAKETGANAKMLNPLEGLSNKKSKQEKIIFRNETKSRCDQRGIKRMSESNTKQMIQLNHVKFGYSDTEVLEEINLTIHEGEYVVLTGEMEAEKYTYASDLR